MPGIARKAVKWKIRVDAAPDWKQGFIFHECDVEYLFLNKARLSQDNRFYLKQLKIIYKWLFLKVAGNGFP